MKKIVTILFIIAMAGCNQKQNQELKPSDMKMGKIASFSIDIPQMVLDDLVSRIKQTRWTDEPDNAGWNYGTNKKYMRELADYWINKYDWHKQEAALNKLPQFKTTIDSVGIHFLYVKGKSRNSKPLILTHG